MLQAPGAVARAPDLGGGDAARIRRRCSPPRGPCGKIPAMACGDAPATLGSRVPGPEDVSRSLPFVVPSGLLPGSAAVWTVLVLLTLLEAVNEIFGVGGPSELYEVWFHDAALAMAAALVLARAVVVPAHRRAWLAFGVAMATWSVATIAWSIAYGGDPNPPYPTFADVLWLLWYPAMVIGIAELIRGHVRQFELHRWMDGIAVTLLVLVVGFAAVVQPATDHSSQGLLATVVDFSYPVLDVLVIGTILGVYGLLSWRPNRMWVLIGAAVVTMAVADAAFAVQQARGVADSGHYDFVWTVGAVAIALAAWIRAPESGAEHVRVTGMRAVVLALVAQALAIGIQIYAIFGEVGKSERVMTALVLVIASVQIVLARPRAGPEVAPADPARPGYSGPASGLPESAPAASSESSRRWK